MTLAIVVLVPIIHCKPILLHFLRPIRASIHTGTHRKGRRTWYLRRVVDVNFPCFGRWTPTHLVSDVGREAFRQVEVMRFIWRILAGSHHRGRFIWRILAGSHHRGQNLALCDLSQQRQKPTAHELHSGRVNHERHSALAVQGRQRELPQFDLQN